MTKVIQVPIEDHILNNYDFKHFADYFRKSYEEFMGVSTKEIIYNIYTLEEQIERYSKNLTFWFIQLDKIIGGKNTKNKIIKIRFIKSQINRLMNTIANIFPGNIPDLIHEKALNMKLIYC